MMEEKKEEYMNKRQGGRVKIQRDGGVQNGECRYQNARVKTDKIKVLNRKEGKK